ncbi:MAG: disulfide oxidoreductase, partial [Geminicoccaceae bacterium]
VEDRLSDALHERLTQRFVDRRTQILLRSLQEGGPLGAVEPDGVVMIEGQEVGRIEGLLPALGSHNASSGDIERRALNAAARRVIGPELMRRVKALVAAGDDTFMLDDQGYILWREKPQHPAQPVGRLTAGATPLAPRLEALVSDQLTGEARETVRRRLAVWLDSHLADLTSDLRNLQAAELEGPARGIAFLLVEGLGNLAAADAEAQIKGLSKASRRRLSKLGVRFGVRHIFLPSMLKSRTTRLRARLFAVQQEKADLVPPPSGRVSLDATGFDEGYASAIGFEQLGRHALRIDIVERLAADLRRTSRAAEPFALSPDMMALTGLGRDDLGPVVEYLGFAADDDGRFRRQAPRSRKRSAKRRKKDAGNAEASPFAALRGLRFETGTG